MTYLGSDMCATNGMSRSRDGTTIWQRHPDNPTFGAVEGDWHCAGICKVSVVDVGDGYTAWNNGFNNALEEMGLAIHKGYDFGFPRRARIVRTRAAIIPPARNQPMPARYIAGRKRHFQVALGGARLHRLASASQKR